MADAVRGWAATHVGHVRAQNEDCCRMPTWVGQDGDARWSGTLERNAVWAVVADGMGGHGAGEVASRTAAASLATSLPSVTDEALIVDAVQLANSRVHDAMMQPSGRPAMGSTVVGLVLTDLGCLVFNVGDSRAYLLRAGRLRMLSMDHTPAARRGTGYRSHALTQSLGGTLTRRPVSPHLTILQPQAGDSLLLCTDGLTDLVSDEAISRILRPNRGQPADDLVGAALEAGGRDNVTVVVLSF